MHVRWLWIPALFWACQSAPGGSTPPESLFYFPENPPSSDWCGIVATEAVPLFPEAGASNRQYMLLQPGVYRLIAQLGNSTSSCMLSVSEAGRVGVYTSAQLPTCLSNQQGYRLEGAATLRYHNERNLGYALSAEDTAYGKAIFLQPESKGQMGFNIYRCANCL